MVPFHNSAAVFGEAASTLQLPLIENNGSFESRRCLLQLAVCVFVCRFLINFRRWAEVRILKICSSGDERS